MAIFKCKMCGGNLEVQDGMTVCECEYCGSKQTVPNLDDEKKINLFSRANRLRSANEFDKAANVYESIVTEFPEEAESYWGLLLCKYGIEYVDDPKTGKKIPTCHRSSFDCIMDDQNFEFVMEYSDPSSRAVYREEAKTIEGLRTRIIEVSSKEEPYDIFICYKETDAMGERTIDSVIAQDVYDKLTEKGYRVFFSRISLEDKLGQEYEPYIFSALNSSKIMLVFGTDYEYYNAVWVKNEWSRFLSLIEKGNNKTLIPCFKGIDAYDMPKEFAKLQAQDMGKVGAIQDLLRGIDKIIGTKSNQETDILYDNSVTQQINVEGKINRAFQYIEDEDFYKAEQLLDNLLEYDNRCSKAYIGLLLCELKLTSESELKKCDEFIGKRKNFLRAKETANPNYKQILIDYENESKNRFMSKSGLAENYEYCVEKFNNPDEYTHFDNLAMDFKKILDTVGLWKDTDKYYEKCCSIVNEKRAQFEKQINYMKDMNAYAERCIRLKGTSLLGIRDNGTVIVAGKEMSSLSNKVSSWSRIVCADITDNGDLVVAIDEKGQFISTSISVTHQMQDYTFKDIKAGLNCIVGIRNDGTVYGLVNNLVFEPKNWVDIVQLECNGNLVVGLDEQGKIYTNSKKINEKLKMQLKAYKFMVCADDDIYVIDIDNNSYALTRNGNFKQFSDVRKIRVVNKHLIAITNQNECISEIQTGLHVRMEKSFSDIGGPKTEKYYKWSGNLVDVGSFNGALYGVKTNGALTHSRKNTTRVDGINYYDFLEVDDEVEDAVLLLTNENVMVVVFSDGSVRTNNEDIDTKTWKLFDDIYLSDDELVKKRKQAAENGNDMFSEDPEIVSERKAAAEIIEYIEKSIEEIKQTNLLPENERVLESIRLEENKHYIEEMYKVTKELAPDIRNQIDEKISELNQVLEEILLSNQNVYDRTIKFCTKCGNPIRTGKNFCSKCGTPVNR